MSMSASFDLDNWSFSSQRSECSLFKTLTRSLSQHGTVNVPVPDDGDGVKIPRD